jgi:hypothetical protein
MEYQGRNFKWTTDNLECIRAADTTRIIITRIIIIIIIIILITIRTIITRIIIIRIIITTITSRTIRMAITTAITTADMADIKMISQSPGFRTLFF